MKMIKKLATVLLAVMLICPCFSSAVLAEDGVAFFTDLETKVGDNFTITGLVVDKSPNKILGDVSVELKYDTEYMRFVEGDEGVVADNGVITYTGSGDGTSDRLEFDMTFQALKEGEIQMDQTGATVTSSDGVDLTDFTMGYAVIKIGEGDPSKIIDESDDVSTSTATGTVTVGDESYTISPEFSEGTIPVGYTKGEFTYNGETYTGIKQDTSGIVAAYLIDAEGSGSFFIYDAQKNTFYPYEEIMISDVYSIVILDGTDEVKMPEKYTLSTIGVNGFDFPVWMEPSRDGFYIFYASNSDGVKSLYLYDSVEHTYQRMETPKTAESNGNEVSGLDKMLAKVEDNLVWFVVGMGCALIVLIVLAIVLAVKLKHRNLELDDLYDEYGIDLEDEDYYLASDDFKEDDFEDEDYEDEFEDDDDYYDDADEDDYYDDDEYEDEYEEYDDEYEEYDDDYEDDDEYYEEDDLASLRKDISESKSSQKSNYDSYYDDDDFEDEDFFEVPSEGKLKKDDTYEMDFIDLE